MFSRNEIGNPHARPTRKYHHWKDMEEYSPNGGMWQIPATVERDGFIEASQNLMADPPKFVESMRRALREWPRSVEVALTTPGLNHRAWLGHAGCFLATGSPEETTRLGWHQLDDGEQWAANAAADQVIREWHQANTSALTEQLPLGDWDA